MNVTRESGIVKCKLKTSFLCLWTAILSRHQQQVCWAALPHVDTWVDYILTDAFCFNCLYLWISSIVDSHSECWFWKENLKGLKTIPKLGNTSEVILEAQSHTTYMIEKRYCWKDRQFGCVDYIDTLSQVQRTKTIMNSTRKSTLHVLREKPADVSGEQLLK
jgi:hypothetical protein